MIYTLLVLIIITYVIIDKILKYQDKQYDASIKNKYLKINNQSLKGVPNEIEKIIALDFFQNSKRFSAAKIDDNYKLFFEISDAETDKTETIYLKEDIFIKPMSLFYYDDYFWQIQSSTVTEEQDLYYVLKFKIVSDQFFYLKVFTDQPNNLRIHYHIKIDFNGRITEKLIDNLDQRYDDSQDKNLIFFDFKKFKEINLINFFDDFFAKENFLYNRNMGDPYSTFFSSDYLKLGICYFFVDENILRGYYAIFDIDNFEKPRLLFSATIDEYGNNFNFSSDDKEKPRLLFSSKIDDGKNFEFSSDDKNVIYWRYRNDKRTELLFTIRELNKNFFQNEANFLIEFSEGFYIKDFKLINNLIIIIGSKKIYFHNLHTNQNLEISRNINSPYCVTADYVFYINNYKLEIIDLSNAVELLI
ncbi:hypothetical protein [Chryseobacterium caseinilyticum]|uniref:Uncharacterized protein n=1 Tax=Chryseobacterium caseinilyticum TaxID=2771428 RepID=A0ABR8ZBM8_9FLAO|nr:hypothetical protein [Chryseobacterium caseinilyticum]MBD8082697.1 hypothetical protein [Chryseobacterium caseinilyticum]